LAQLKCVVLERVGLGTQAVGRDDSGDAESIALARWNGKLGVPALPGFSKDIVYLIDPLSLQDEYTG
jgi:hypothetical protein